MSQEVDTVIAGGQLVGPRGITQAAIAVDGGRIVLVGRNDHMPAARERINAEGLFVLPGAIDVHVHFREPGFSHKETWTSATQAAAVGGVTTVFDMPNTNPPTATVEALLQKKIIAERQALVDFGIYGLIGETNPAAHLAQHVDVAAIEAVSRTAIFSEWTGCKVHIAHESSRFSLPHIRFAKQRGVDLTVETCPHYLFLSSADGARLSDALMRVKPPVREPGHSEPLWEALLDGAIDMLSTDHAPHLPEEKRRASIWDCASGFPGVETSMRLMLTEINRGRLTLCDYVRMASYMPAKAFGLYPRKGSLVVGGDADIVLVDLKVRASIRADALHSIGNATPFEAFETVGLPVWTLVRGRTVAEKGRPVGPQGWGRMVSRT